MHTACDGRVMGCCDCRMPIFSPCIHHHKQMPRPACTRLLQPRCRAGSAAVGSHGQLGAAARKEDRRAHLPASSTGSTLPATCTTSPSSKQRTTCDRGGGGLSGGRRNFKGSNKGWGGSARGGSGGWQSRGRQRQREAGLRPGRLSHTRGCWPRTGCPAPRPCWRPSPGQQCPAGSAAQRATSVRAASRVPGSTAARGAAGQSQQ